MTLISAAHSDFEIPLLVDGRYDPAIPDIAEVAFLAAIGQKPGAEYRHAFPAFVTHAPVEDTIRASAAQVTGERLRHRIVRRIIKIGMAFAHRANVMYVGGQVDRIDPHVQFLRRFFGSHEKARAMPGRFGNRGFQGQACIEDTVRSVGEAIAKRIEVGESSHDRRRARTRHPVLDRNERKVAGLLAQPIVGHRLDLEDRVEVGRVGDGLEQGDRRKTAGHDPVAGMPPDGCDRNIHP